jgi:hypothetical protein
MKATTTPRGGPDAKTAFYAEQLVLLEIVGTDRHAPSLEELERLEDPPEAPAGLRRVPKYPTKPSVADEPEELPLAGGLLGHDLDGAGLRLPPDAYSAAVWETPCEAVS